MEKNCKLSSVKLEGQILDIIVEVIGRTYPSISHELFDCLLTQYREEQPYSIVLFCLDDETVIAFAIVQGSNLDMLYVHPDYYNRGCGSFLLEEAIQVYHAETLSVIASNERLLEFFRKRGFVVERPLSGSEVDPMFPCPLVFMRLKNPPQKMVKVTEFSYDCNKILKLGDCSLERGWKYLDNCDLFQLEKMGKVIGVAAVNDEGRIMNFAVSPTFQKQYYGIYMYCFLRNYYKGKYRWLTIAVGGHYVPYLRLLGFKVDRAVRDYFFRSLLIRVKPNRKYDSGDLVYMKIRIDK